MICYVQLFFLLIRPYFCIMESFIFKVTMIQESVQFIHCLVLHLIVFNFSPLWFILNLLIKEDTFYEQSWLISKPILTSLGLCEVVSTASSLILKNQVAMMSLIDNLTFLIFLYTLQICWRSQLMQILLGATSIPMSPLCTGNQTWSLQ